MMGVASIACASLVVAKHNARPGPIFGLFLAQAAMLALVGQILEASDGVRVSPELALLVAVGHVTGLIAVVGLAWRRRRQVRLA